MKSPCGALTRGVGSRQGIAVKRRSGGPGAHGFKSTRVAEDYGNHPRGGTDRCWRCPQPGVI